MRNVFAGNTASTNRTSYGTVPVGRVVTGPKKAKISWRPMRTPARARKYGVTGALSCCVSEKVVPPSPGMRTSLYPGKAGPASKSTNGRTSLPCAWSGTRIPRESSTASNPARRIMICSSALYSSIQG